VIGRTSSENAQGYYAKRRDALDRLADEAQLSGVVVPPDLAYICWTFADAAAWCDRRRWLEQYDPDPFEGAAVTSRVLRAAVVAEARRILA
jgi:hypothetical protein